MAEIQSALNPVIAFIAKLSPPCSKSSCGTCGGTYSFIQHLKNEFTDQDEILQALGEMSGEEIKLLKEHGFGIDKLLSTYQPEQSRGVVSKWLDRVNTDSIFANGLLKWLWMSVEMPAVQNMYLLRNVNIFDLINIVDPKRLENMETRDRIKDWIYRCGYAFPIPNSLIAAFREDGMLRAQEQRVSSAQH